jgi:hypothetical protein
LRRLHTHRLGCVPGEVSDETSTFDRSEGCVTYRLTRHNQFVTDDAGKPATFTGAGKAEIQAVIIRAEVVAKVRGQWMAIRHVSGLRRYGAFPLATQPTMPTL